MKKLKFIALSLITVAVCLGIASCSNDDDEPEQTVPEMPQPSVKKRLTQVTYPHSVCDISYDQEGRIEKVVSTHNGAVNKTTTYSYSSSQIQVTEINISWNGHSSSYMETYSLSNGLITKIQDDWFLTYKSGRISKWTDGGGYKNFEWSMGDISSTLTHWSKDNRATYEYSDKYDYGRIVGIIADSNDLLFDDFEPYLVMQGYFGQTPIHLVQAAIDDRGDGSDDLWKWQYEFDQDGYPISVTTSLNGRNTDTFHFSWMEV